MSNRPYGETGMQISRHWRLNSTRYRLEGVRYPNGDVSLQSRPIINDVEPQPQPQARIEVLYNLGFHIDFEKSKKFFNEFGLATELNPRACYEIFEIILALFKASKYINRNDLLQILYPEKIDMASTTEQVISYLIDLQILSETDGNLRLNFNNLGLLEEMVGEP